MTAAGLLLRLQDAGFVLDVAGESLSVTPASQLSDADRALLRAHKHDLVNLLVDVREAFEERAAILEFEAGLTKMEAERRACECCRHQLRYGTCHEPVKAGLDAPVAAGMTERFKVIWPPEGYGQSCPAFTPTRAAA